jgi:DNA-binding FadR family transcriptional regulator
MEQIIEQTIQKSNSGEIVHRENIQFHLYLAEIARNQIIYSAYRSMMDLLLSSFLALGVGSDHYKDVAQSHRHLLDTLKQGNEDLFVKEVETHVKKAGSNLMQIAKQSPLFSGNMK